MAQYLLQGYDKKGPFWGALYADEDGFHAFGAYAILFGKDGAKLGNQTADYMKGTKPLWLLDRAPLTASIPVVEHEMKAKPTMLATLESYKYGPPPK